MKLPHVSVVFWQTLIWSPQPQMDWAQGTITAGTLVTSPASNPLPAYLPLLHPLKRHLQASPHWIPQTGPGVQQILSLLPASTPLIRLCDWLASRRYTTQRSCSPSPHPSTCNREAYWEISGCRPHPPVFSCWDWIFVCREKGQVALPLHRLPGHQLHHSQEQVPYSAHLLSIHVPLKPSKLQQARPEKHLPPDQDQGRRWGEDHI